MGFIDTDLVAGPIRDSTTIPIGQYTHNYMTKTKRRIKKKRLKQAAIA